MTEPAAWTVGFRWKSRLCWRTTPNRRLPRPRTCTRRHDVPMSSSRFQALPKAYRPSKKRSLPGCRSTSRCCSPTTSIWRPPIRSCAASIFISRWDVAVTGKVPEALNDRLGIAIAKRTYKAYLGLLSSPRWMRAYNAGARPQRLLWASTGTKDPKASDVLYVNTLAAPFTVNTIPDGTLKALAEHGDVGATIPADGGNSEGELARFADAKIDVHALSRQLQDEGAKSFVKSWNDLLGVIGSKSALLKRAS